MKRRLATAAAAQTNYGGSGTAAASGGDGAAAAAAANRVKCRSSSFPPFRETPCFSKLREEQFEVITNATASKKANEER